MMLCLLTALFKHHTGSKLRGWVICPHGFPFSFCYRHWMWWLPPHEPENIQFPQFRQQCWVLTDSQSTSMSTWKFCAATNSPHLKPRLRRARPPPLDLRGLSTITECPTHLPLSRAMTESCFPLNCLPERILENGGNSRNEDTNCTPMESRQFCLTLDGAVQTWARRSNLDYLSLDFNSASQSPVQKKPFLSDDHKVDYVQVDEKKTQALQNTKMEWTDVRQSKT